MSSSTRSKNIERGAALCPTNEKPMTDTTNPHLFLCLGIILVGAFQAGFSMEIFKEVDLVECVLDINILISFSVRTLGFNKFPFISSDDMKLKAF